jgi:hypothetical protein
MARVRAELAFQRLLGLLICNIIYFVMSINDIEKRGRGRPTTGSTPVLVRVQPDQLAKLDQWAAKQKDKPGRSEAIRRLVERGLKLR